MANVPVVSTLLNENSFLTDIKAGNHQFQSDEPVDLGGSDKATDPMSMALASLGACTAMTLKIYYAHKQTSWDKIDVHVNSELQHIDKSTAPEDVLSMANNGKVRTITKVIHIKSDMDDKLLERAAIIADKCPVNLMMKKGCKMETIIKRI